MATTRAEAVLQLLQERAPEWVEGHELCTPEIGGSEGLRRLRELAHRIDRERIPGRDEWRYRYVPPVESVSPKRDDGMRPNSMPGRPDRYVNMQRAQAQSIDNARRQAMKDEQARLMAQPYRTGPLRIVFGQTVCRSCEGTGGNLSEGACWRCQGKGVGG